MVSQSVAHVLRKYDPNEWGGTETHVVAITRALGAHGWRSEVHAPLGPSASDQALASGVSLRRYHAFAPFVGPREQRRALFKNAGNIASLHEPIRLAGNRQLALAHVHTLKRIGGGVRTAMRWTGRPYVVSVHGPLLAEADMVAQDTAQRLHGLWDIGKPIGMLLGARRVLEDAARVICFNDDEFAALRDRIGDRAVRMEHGVDVARMERGDADRARQRWPEFGDAPVVALVGRMADQKNQLLAVEAFARGAPPDHHLVFAGAQTDIDYGGRVEKRIAELGLGDRIHLLGNLDPNVEVPDLFCRSRLVITPSKHEAFGLCVLEGWAARRPVLFSRIAGMADIADAVDDDRMAVAELSVEAWSNRLATVLQDATQLNRSAERGFALVQRKFDWTTIAKQLDALYREVLDEHGVTITAS